MIRLAAPAEPAAMRRAPDITHSRPGTPAQAGRLTGLVFRVYCLRHGCRL